MLLQESNMREKCNFLVFLNQTARTYAKFSPGSLDFKTHRLRKIKNADIFDEK